MTEQPTGPGPVETRTVELAGQDVTIERVSARKASRAFAILRAVGKEVPKLVNAWGEFITEYERAHVVELDRTRAKARYGPSPLLENGIPVRYPDTVALDDGRLEPHPRAGEVVMVPGDLDHMTEEDWAASGNVLRLSRSPSSEEAMVAMFPRALELAEEQVYELLALFTLPNARIKEWRRDGTLDQHIKERVDELLDDAYGDELLELAVVCGELVDSQFVGKAQALGGRLGNALRLLGLNPASLARQTAAQEPQTEPGETPATSSSEPSSTSPPSSTASPESSPDGPPTPSSTSPSTSSPQSATA